MRKTFTTKFFSKKSEKKANFSMFKLHRFVFASVVFGIGMNMFVVPCKIIAGGFSGVALILKILFGFPVGITVILLNLPFLAANAAAYGFDYIKRALFGVLSTGGFTELFVSVSPIECDRAVGAVLGGALVGAAMGMLFSLGYTTGGTDLAATLAMRTRIGEKLSLGKHIFVLDTLIIICGFAVMKDIIGAVLAVVCIFVQSFFIDCVMKHTKSSRSVHV